MLLDIIARHYAFFSFFGGYIAQGCVVPASPISDICLGSLGYYLIVKDTGLTSRVPYIAVT